MDILTRRQRELDYFMQARRRPLRSLSIRASPLAVREGIDLRLATATRAQAERDSLSRGQCGCSS